MEIGAPSVAANAVAVNELKTSALARVVKPILATSVTSTDQDGGRRAVSIAIGCLGSIARSDYAR